MSAAIIQKNTTTIFFECSDIFNANKPNDNEHRIVSRGGVSSSGGGGGGGSGGGVTPMIQDISAMDHQHHHDNQLSAAVSKQSQQQQQQHSQQLNNNNNTINANNNNKYDSKDKLMLSTQLKDHDQQTYNLHNALTRTISQPQPQPQRDPNVTTLVTTIIENLGSMNIHRKLERTQSEPLPQQLNTSRYKTELCRPFEEAGECKYGEKCQFAHGYHELRNLQRHPKYKTEYCRTFHSVGFCPYGPRCHFVHNADEARALQQLQQQQLQQQQAAKLQIHSGTASTAITGGVGAVYPVVGVGIGIGATSTTVVNNQALPMSPPLSMSTGSDRESPTGSLSISPTTSLTNFPFGEQISPVLHHTGFQSITTTTSSSTTAFAYVNTPPDSPNAPISPVNTPPPGSSSIALAPANQVFIKPVTLPGKQVLQKSSSSPIAAVARRGVGSKTPTKVNSTSSLNGEDARLPVFNRLSSAFDKYTNVAL